MTSRIGEKRLVSEGRITGNVVAVYHFLLERPKVISAPEKAALQSINAKSLMRELGDNLGKMRRN